MSLQLNWLKAGGTSLGYVANYIRGFPCLSSWHFSLSRQRRTVATGTSFLGEELLAKRRTRVVSHKGDVKVEARVSMLH